MLQVSRCHAAIVVALAVALKFTTVARGADSGSSAIAAPLMKLYTLDIKRQPLADALAAFTKDTGIRVSFAESAVRGFVSPGLTGTYGGLESLTRLLEGTGFSFKPGGDQVVLSATSVIDPKAPLAQPLPALDAAWKKFYATVDQVKAETIASTRFQTEPWTRAKGFHALMEAQAMAYNFAVAPRFDYPRIQEATSWQLNTYTLGQNGPDSLYGIVMLDGHQTYKVTGRMGDQKLVLMQVFSHVLGRPDAKPIGNYDMSSFKPDREGNFSAMLGGPQQSGNWIKLDPDSTDNWIMIRRWVTDWNADAGDIRIEMTSKPEPGHYDFDEFDEAAMARRIDSAGDVLKYLVESWNISLYDQYLNESGGEKNHMTLLPGVATSQFGSPTSNYALGIFDLKPDEALIVTVEPPRDAAYWSFQLGDPWSRSLDFMNRQTSINMAQAVLDSDGKFRAVISGSDPGVANWLDTADHPDGTICFRNYRSSGAPVPAVQKVALADLWKYLPKDTKRITSDERAAAIEHRRAGIAKAYDNVF